MSKIVKDVNKLREKSEPVASAQEATGIIQQIKEELDKCETGLGLAAVQVGVNKKVGVIKIRNDKIPNGISTFASTEKYIYLINSELLEKEDEFIYFNEGCLSFPDTFLNTVRYKQILIKNYRIENEELKEEKLVFYYSNDKDEIANSGIYAICVQHELDHFDGKLIIDHNVKSEPVKSSEKIGRNDPCPCGKKDSSGKPIKYKKCCLKE